ncbi:M24 family metallopeptidase [Pseudalkalibacillus hwajinpoensis]|uniref:Aminopeptidase P family protein n=1 Tax=Guptibacillus hwajinpoensis TaxID=208199 RepID=A0A4U1MB79_9BACL|nr:Xaa-Pro peptidase family protein [Pseudalkalibacillus hwajinpoensis]TKD67484.1 aminopeptidase P family protein [Pseudalkalibacillus hwajinpoensis]
MNERLTKFTEWLTEQNQDFAFLHSPSNVFYLTNFHCEPHERLLGLFVVPNHEPFLVCPGMEESQARDAGWQYDIIGYSDSEEPFDFIHEALKARGIQNPKSASIEKSTLAYERVEKLQNHFSEIGFHSAELGLNELRLIKDEKEIEILREAASLADFGVQTGVEALQEGITEMEVLATIEFELKKKGIREMSFSTMVLFGEKSGQPHGNPGQRKLKTGDLVLFDLGVVLNGYCSDITRTVAFGNINEKQKEIYETVLRAQNESLSISKPGTRLGDIDLAARNVISEAGYGDFFPHRIGHGIGIEVHEYPSMSEKNDSLLQKGMTYTIEPGIYLPEVGGVRIEDDVLVTDNGYETLTKYPKELQIIR